MKTFPEHLEQIAKEFEYDNWDDVIESVIKGSKSKEVLNSLIKSANNRYAKQTAQDHIQRAAIRSRAKSLTGK